MKNNVIKTILILLVFLMILMICQEVYASNFNIDFKVDESNQDKNTVVVILSLKDVNFNNILSTIEGNVEYDRSVFTDVKLENLNGWGIVLNTEENADGKLVGFKIGNEEIKQEDLCKITFVINENIENANTKISLKNIKSADGDNLVATDDKTVDIQIGNGETLSVKTENTKLNRKTILKYVLILVIIVLLLTVSTSSMYLIQKYKLKKKYNFKQK